IALCAIVAGLLGVIAVSATATAAANRSDTTKVMDRLTPAQVDAERLYSQLLRQQSAIRTFAVTGRDSDLDAYRDAQVQERQILPEAETLLSAEPRLLAAVHDIAATTQRYRSEVTEPLIAQTRANGPSAERAAPTDESRVVYATASDRINAL